jgi:hypothetical protein
MKLIKILYNDACGDWSFSDEFFSEEFINIFKERYGDDLDLESGAHKVRYDPRVIALYEELGMKRSSHETARLKLTHFPEELIKYMKIFVYDGGEVIGLDKEKAYEYLIEEIICSDISKEDIIAKFTVFKNYEKPF